MTTTRSRPDRKDSCAVDRIARTWRFSRLRRTAPLKPRRVRSPRREYGWALGAAPMESAVPRAHRPRLDTTWNASVRFSGLGFNPGSAASGPSVDDDGALAGRPAWPCASETRARETAYDSILVGAFSSCWASLYGRAGEKIKRNCWT